MKAAMEKLQQILLFRELEFPLKDIKEIVNRSDFDKTKALEQQIELLELKKEQGVFMPIPRIITSRVSIFARGLG